MGLRGAQSPLKRLLTKARTNITPRKLIAGGAVLAVALLTNAYAQNRLTLNNKAYADGQHLVSVFVDGNKRVMATSAGTVGGALEQLKVDTGKGDVIEPAPTTAIDQPIFNINIYRAMPATIFDDGKKVQVLTGYQSPRQIVAAAGLTSYPEDIVTLDRVDNFVLGGTVGRQVTIRRAKPVQVVIAGQVYNFRTQKNTVGELFAEKGLQVNSGDVVNLSIDAPLSAGQRIVVNRLSQSIVQQKESIPASVSYEYDANQPLGYSTVKQAGKDGTKIVSFLVSLTNGSETGRSKLDENVIESPSPRVIVKGSKVVVVNSSDAVGVGQRLATARGWDGEEWLALYQLWNRESKWNPAAQNGGSGACGIPQAYPCSKLGGAFPGNVEGQITWGLNYIAGRYGTPAKAWAYWLSHGSY